MRFAHALLMCLSCAAFGCTASNPSLVVDDCPKANATPPPAIASTAAAANLGPSKAAPRIVEPFPDITVHLDAQAGSRVEIIARTCLDEGLLEQVACSPQTREHESLMVVKAKPSQIHAALLMAGFEPGSPGKWTYDGNAIGTVDPRGENVDVLVRHITASGEAVEHPVRQWIRNSNPSLSGDEAVFPREPWVFAGSLIRSNPPPMEPGEHYVADMTGSIIGLVTFGDEVLGFSRVLADQESVQAPVWEVNRGAALPLDTPVPLSIRKWPVAPASRPAS